MNPAHVLASVALLLIGTVQAVVLTMLGWPPALVILAGAPVGVLIGEVVFRASERL